MKRAHLWALAALAAAVVVLWACPALAAKKQQALPEWRQWWNLAWKWINAGILIFIIVKFGRQPMKDFLANQKATLAAEIQEMEAAKAEAQAELTQMQTKIDGLADELKSFQEHLTASAARERDQMLEEAKFEAENIIERTQRQAEMALTRARQEMTVELVEMAGQMAEEKLAQAVNADDQRRLVSEFIDQAEQQNG